MYQKSAIIDYVLGGLAVSTEVYLRDDPGMRGYLTGRVRERPDGKAWFVKWSNGSSGWKPEYELVFVEDGQNDDVFTLLKRYEFGRLNDLRRNITYIQLSGRLANVVYSMDTTNTDFYAYQFKPVLTFLESPSGGILIADEVGLGKTIEAGLIWTELRARFDARRLVVVCPAMLREKWCNELNARFGVDATQMNAAELLTELKKDKHTVAEGKAYVCSLQGMRPPTGWKNAEKQKSASAILARFLEELEQHEPVIDLVIIDEAHYLRNSETQSAVFGRLIREVSENIVLLSATPINNKATDLFSLLKLVDPDTFSDKSVFPQVLLANEPLIMARKAALDPNAGGAVIRQYLESALSHSLLGENRQLRGLLARDYSEEYLAEKANRIDLANRIERINLLQHAVIRTRKVEVQELKVVREAYSQFVPVEEDSIEWVFYIRVTESIRRYARDKGINEGFLLAPPQRQVSSCMYAAAASWLNKTGIEDIQSLLYEDIGEDEHTGEDYSPLIEYIVNHALPGIDIEQLRTHDSKYKAFRKVVVDHLGKHPTDKIIVFSFFKGTLYYLAERLAQERIKSQLLHGSIGEMKQDVIDRFKGDANISVLLTSEVASEGVDLQFCRVLINYDLPWNPMRIEQRIGRIDRIGQESEKILIWNLGYANTIDQRIFDLLLDKLNIFEQALGGMEAILGEMIGELTSDLLTRPLTPVQEAKRIELTYIAAENNRQQQEELESNAAHLIAHGGYILERVKAAHEFKRRISDMDLKLFVKDYMDRYCHGHMFRESEKDRMVVDIRLPAETLVKLDEFIRQNRLFGLTALASGNIVECRFINKIRGMHQRQESINQLHPFVRFISKHLKEMGQAFYPLVAVKLDSSSLPSLKDGIYAFSVKKWTFTGIRTEEVIHARVVNIGGSDMRVMDPEQSWELVNAARVNGEEWYAVKNEIDTDYIESAFDACDMKIGSDYAIKKTDYENENTDRVVLQINTAEKHLNRLLKTQNELLDKYRLQGKRHLLPMTEGKISAITNKFEMQIEKLRQKAGMTSSSTDVAYGVIRVD